MPLISGASDLNRLAEDILEGRRRLIAWGGDIDVARVSHWQCPLPIHSLADTSWLKWCAPVEGLDCQPPAVLKSLPPDAVAVATHYNLGQSYVHVRAFMDHLPLVPHFIPGHLTRWTESGEGRDDPALLDEAIFGYGGIRDDGGMARRLLAAAPWAGHAARARALAAAMRAGRRASLGRKAALFVERMNLGGAERQVCGLAAGLRRLGWEVTLVTQMPWPQEAAHYRAELDRQGVDCVEAPVELPGSEGPLGESMARTLGADGARLLWHVPALLVPGILGLRRTLAGIEPDLLVCYLDRPNLMGAVAGCLTGVPEILMSGRNVNPSHFPHFYQGQIPAFEDVYRMMTGLDGIRLSANSRVGAESYAKWLGLADRSVAEVPNGVMADAFDTGTPMLRRALRRLLGLPERAKLLLGVFRLADEKNPLAFVDVAARLMAERADLHAVICGGGSLDEAVRDRLRHWRVEDRFTLLNGISAMPLLMGAATLLLHTSRVEGTPNALLEAQAAGLPIVCTATGGSEDCLSAEARAHVHPQGDLAGLAASCRLLLDDEGERRRLARIGKAHVRRHYSIARLARNTLAAARARGSRRNV